MAYLLGVKLSCQKWEGFYSVYLEQCSTMHHHCSDRLSFIFGNRVGNKTAVAVCKYINQWF